MKGARIGGGRQMDFKGSGLELKVGGLRLDGGRWQWSLRGWLGGDGRAGFEGVILLGSLWSTRK